nr:uncharacterized protein LOC128703051 [Cherax quadricarinatus]
MTAFPDENEDTLYLTRGTCVCWIPKYIASPRPSSLSRQYMLCLDHADYRPFWTMTRVVHVDKFQEIMKEGLKPRLFMKSELTILPRIVPHLRGLYFGIPEKGHNWYGNVSMEAQFKKFLKALRPRVYFIDSVDFKVSSLTRLLLTTRKYDNYFSRYDAKIIGGPWYRDPDGTDWHLVNARRYNSEKRNRICHRLEFVLDLKDLQYEKLLSMCKILPADHTQANTGKPRTCREYYSGRQFCPYPWSIARTERYLSRVLV